MAGREPYGCVQPGDEYNRRRGDHRTAADVAHPETNELVVETITVARTCITATISSMRRISSSCRRLEYFGFGEYEFGSHKIIESMRRGISGTHRMNGVFMAYGAAIRPGVEVEDASLVDLAPTILHLMGESVPAHMDGRVLAEAIAQGDRAEVRREWRSRSAADVDPADAGLSDEDRKVLAERLRSLGYVG